MIYATPSPSVPQICVTRSATVIQKFASPATRTSPELHLSLANMTPFRWPSSWHDPAKIGAVIDTPFNCAVGDDITPEVVSAMRAKGIATTTLKAAPVTVVQEPRWPQVQLGSHGSESGPTGTPWVDANGFAILVARAISPDKPVWLTEQPPAKRVLRPDHFRLAVCDAAAYGGCWLPSPDLDAWPQIVAAQKFFSEHREWESWRPVARLAVVSAFTGPHRELAVETLNLLTRQYVPFAVFHSSHADKSELARYALVLNVDEHDASMDPWQLASEAREKLGRQNDIVRLWNGTSLNFYYTASADNRSGLLQLLNYTAHRPGQDVTVAVLSPWRSARIYTLENPAPAPIELHRANTGVEIYLPPFSVYAAVELIK